MTMNMRSARLGLPLLAPGQAGKDISHNEALALLDIASACVVRGSALRAPDMPATGECWIVATGATGSWAGQDGAVAGWSGGGWRFVKFPHGAVIHMADDGRRAERTADGWRIGDVVADQVVVDGQHVVRGRGGAVANAQGGSTIDLEARAALSQLLDRLRDHGLIAR